MLLGNKQTDKHADRPGVSVSTGSAGWHASKLMSMFVYPPSPFPHGCQPLSVPKLARQSDDVTEATLGNEDPSKFMHMYIENLKTFTGAPQDKLI